MTDNDPWDAMSEEPFHAMLHDNVLRRLRRKRFGPLATFLIWLAGGDRRVLEFVPPSESRIFVLLGSTMMFTGIVAGLLGFTSTGYLLRGGVVLDQTTLIGGVVVFVAILALDRLLIKAPLNPYRFPPKTLAALWNPKADATWFDVLIKDMVEPTFAERTGATMRVLRRGFIRIVIATVTSYLFAQSALFFVFSDELQTVAEGIRASQRQELAASLTSAHDQQKATLQKAIDSYSGSNDPNVKALNVMIDKLNAVLNAKQADIATITLAIGNEAQGFKQCFKFASADAPKNGLCTSGHSGSNGHDYRTDVGLRADWEDQAKVYRTTLSMLNGKLAARKKALTSDKSTRKTIARLDRQISTLDNQLTTDLASVDAPLGRIKGILIRNQALTALEKDNNPEVTPITKIKDCASGFGGFFCSLSRIVYVPTPIGPYVAAFKILFFCIEILPIVLKIVFSLRERRPYDELEAAIEEVGRAKTTEMLDNQLIQVGARLESRATWRKAQRSAVGTEFLLAAAEARVSSEDQKLRDIIFGNAIVRRRRFWPIWPRKRPLVDRDGPPESSGQPPKPS